MMTMETIEQYNDDLIYQISEAIYLLRELNLSPKVLFLNYAAKYLGHLASNMHDESGNNDNHERVTLH